MKTLASYIESVKKSGSFNSDPEEWILESEAMPANEDEMQEICSKNKLCIAMQKQCAKYGYKFVEAYNETLNGKLFNIHVEVVPLSPDFPKLIASFPKGKGNMMVDIPSAGRIGGAALDKWLGDLQKAVSLAKWIDKQDLSKLPAFEEECDDVEEADVKKPQNFEVAYRMFDRKGQIVNKRKAFKKADARAKFVEKIKQDGNFYEIVGYLDD